jgi:hypothetical protein
LLVVISPTATDYGGATSGSFPEARPVQREWHSGKDRLMSFDEIVKYLRDTQLLEPYKTVGALSS